MTILIFFKALISILKFLKTFNFQTSILVFCDDAFTCLDFSDVCNKIDYERADRMCWKLVIPILDWFSRPRRRRLPGCFAYFWLRVIDPYTFPLSSPGGSKARTPRPFPRLHGGFINSRCQCPVSHFVTPADNVISIHAAPVHAPIIDTTIVGVVRRNIVRKDQFSIDMTLDIRYRGISESACLFFCFIFAKYK